ncbi:glycosyltransferase family 39 protein [Defluviimonas sp. WL0024]|uniref:Glycosyltransferase family 39 protein n=2 Tax=Albidovulum TaxID=205889 RepID=A0ABT3J9X0_9RHOB|nr:MULTISPECIES: glycosyltransferase family 39 protein [Defluviimonas]MCU9850456.1 glycosyltransferase family 39 protein [Defluviimonas sp. WL0024]MCW3784484.1 glycosyltransferase family 39 protein [Defluviimonas salinarum]
MPDRSGWFPRAVLVVGALTLARIVALWFDRTDLFVDESQYWLWGQRLDFGYYSKPPLIAWVIRAATELAGSDAPFWIRLPGLLFHGATALILGTLAARLFSARAALWVAVSYATLPMVALGSLLISTDTIMAPFFAAALYFYFRAVEAGRARFAALAGAAAGVAFLAKYAAVYFLLGAALASVVPAARLSGRAWAAMLAAFAVTILPNVAWNLGHDLTTVEHTMDNVGWVREASWYASLNPGGLTSFLFAQFGVFGPVLVGALLWGYATPGSATVRALVAFSLPVLVIVSVQALLMGAQANWAVAAYFPGTLIAVPLLLVRAPRLLALSLAVNGTVAILLPVLTVIAPAPEWQGRPLAARYLGRADLSRQIIAAAREAGTETVVIDNRDMIADLFHTGDGSGLAFRTPRPVGRPASYYEQNFPLEDDAGEVLFVSIAPPVCGGAAAEPVAELDTTNGAYFRRKLTAYLVPAECLNARP